MEDLNTKINQLFESYINPEPVCCFPFFGFQKPRRTFLTKNAGNSEHSIADKMHSDWHKLKTPSHAFVLIYYQLDFVYKYKNKDISNSCMYKNLIAIKNELAKLYPRHAKVYALIHKEFQHYLKGFNRTFNKHDIYYDSKHNTQSNHKNSAANKDKKGFAWRILESLTVKTDPKDLDLSESKLNTIFSELKTEVDYARKHSNKSNKFFFTDQYKPSAMLETLKAIQEGIKSIGQAMGKKISLAINR